MQSIYLVSGLSFRNGEDWVKQMITKNTPHNPILVGLLQLLSPWQTETIHTEKIDENCEFQDWDSVGHKTRQDTRKQQILITILSWKVIQVQHTWQDLLGGSNGSRNHGWVEDSWYWSPTSNTTQQGPEGHKKKSKSWNTWSRGTPLPW